MMNGGLTGLHLPGLDLTLRGLISLRKSHSSCPDLSEIENYSPSASTGCWSGPAAALSAGPDQCILRGNRVTLCCVTKGSMLPTVPGSVRCSRSCVLLLWTTFALRWERLLGSVLTWKLSKKPLFLALANSM